MRGVTTWLSRSGMALSLLVVVAVTGVLFAQSKEQRLGIQGDHGTVRAKGYIGGEAHDLYTINVAAGKTMVVRVISKKNRAEFYVSQSAEPQSEPVHFGAMNEKLRTWTGTIPTAGDYFIVVNAYPSARYTLVVSVN